MWEILTVFLILSPVMPRVPHKAPEELWKPLKAVALHLEVVGPHENWIDDYRSELDYVRNHWRELRETPTLSDAALFPAQFTVKDCHHLNHVYQRMLESRAAVYKDRQDFYRDLLSESHRLGEIWGEMETATCPTQSWVCRRRALQHLKDKLGPEDYYNGAFPPAIPLWRFSR